VVLQTPHTFDYEARGVDCRCFSSDVELEEILACERPQVIVSFGRREEYAVLQNASHAVQRKWLHFEGEADAARIEAAGALVFARFLHNALAVNSNRSAPNRVPLISVFTPTYRTGEMRLQRAYDSLRRQEYSHWEWVVVDDSDDDRQTLQLLASFATRDARVKVFPSLRHSGLIGEVKRRACRLAEGDIFVELDHDDEFTPNALGDVVSAFAQFPEAGFVYSNWVELHEKTGQSLTYGENWAFGYGAYCEQEYSGKTLQVAQAPPINCETIRHIVSAPNHLRAWKQEEYWRCGGHNAELHVADDYELIVRTFLNTRMVHIPRLCYLQYLDGRNTTDARRSEIQRLVRNIAQFYDIQIHERLLELGLEDAAWDEANGGTSFPFYGLSGPRQTRHCTLTADL